jgi:hypothetical protein
MEPLGDDLLLSSRHHVRRDRDARLAIAIPAARRRDTRLTLE